MLDRLAAGKPTHALLNWSRALQPHVELTATEYVDTIMEAADLLNDGRHAPGGVVVLDQVNPFPSCSVDPAAEQFVVRLRRADPPRQRGFQRRRLRSDSNFSTDAA